MKRNEPHVCTKWCLGWSVTMGRRFYYCKQVKPVPRPERAR